MDAQCGVAAPTSDWSSDVKVPTLNNVEGHDALRASNGQNLANVRVGSPGPSTNLQQWLTVDAKTSIDSATDFKASLCRLRLNQIQNLPVLEFQAQFVQIPHA